MLNLKNKVFTLIVCFFGFMLFGNAHASSEVFFHSPAKEAVLLDFNSGAILFEQEAHKLTSPSSMTKTMTIYMVFEALTRGIIDLDTKFYVSKKAWKQKGSRMFVEVGHDVSVKDLIQGTIVSSGNDSSIVLAEGLAGSEESFAEQMTNKAKALGAKNTVFLNSNGWPDLGHQSSVYDLALIARATIRDFPKLYKKFYSQQQYTYDNIKQYSQNKLLFQKRPSYVVDGLKTGHTSSGGFGLSFSAKKDDFRVVGVVNGLDSAKERIAAARNLLQWAFHTFSTKKIVTKGPVMQLPMKNGEKKSISLVALKNYYYSFKTREAQYPLTEIQVIKDQAPIKAGEHIATLKVTGSLQPELEIPLYAKDSIEEYSFVQKYYRKLLSLVVDPEEPTIEDLQSGFTKYLKNKIKKL